MKKILRSVQSLNSLLNFIYIKYLSKFKANQFCYRLYGNMHIQSYFENLNHCLGQQVFERLLFTFETNKQAWLLAGSFNKLRLQYY